MFCWANIPPQFIEREIAPHTEFAIWQALVSPRLELRSLEVEGLGDGSWLIRLVVENSGWLPTSVTEQAVQRKAVKPLEAEITLPDGGKVIGGERKVELGQLDGRVNRRSLLWWVSNDATSDRAKVEWVVEAPAGSTATVEARHPARRDRSPRREPGLGAPVSEMRHRWGGDDAVELQLGRFELVEQANATA